MDLIPIQINQAKIESLSLDFTNESELRWSATVGLLDNVGTWITSITVGNSSWKSKNEQAELSLLGVELTARLRKEISDAVTLHMNKMNKTIDVKK